MDNTDNKEQVITKAPIEIAKPSPSDTLPLVATRAPVDPALKVDVDVGAVLGVELEEDKISVTV